MLTARLLFALLFPLLAGAGALHAFWPQTRVPGRWPSILGYGWLAGWLLVALALWVWDKTGLPLGLVGVALLTLGFALLVAAVGLRLPDRPWQPVEARRCEGHWPELLVAVALVLILLRLWQLAAETALMPLFPWDAWMNWAPKSRAWFEARHLVPFVPDMQWLAAQGPAYTITTWSYPPAVPLIQLWTALCGGDSWDDTLIGLPWVTCLMALALALYGQLRQWGSSAAGALVFVYLLVSTPLVGANVGLAGYADLWLGAVYALAVMSLLQWVRTDDLHQAVLALLFGCSLIALKNAGVAWALSLPFALLVRRASPLPLIVLALVAGAAWWIANHPLSVQVPGFGNVHLSSKMIAVPGFIYSKLELHPVWWPLLLNAFGYDNWHLLWYLLPPVLLILPVLAARERWARSALALMFAVFLLGFAILFLTDRSAWVEDFTIVNRTLLHVAPAFLFMFALVWHGLRTRDGLFRDTFR